jgi:hypothetical protein
MDYVTALPIDDIPTPIPANPTRFIDQYRLLLRLQGKSYSTEKTYVYWALYFIRFCNKDHPKARAAEDVTAFLTHLVTQRDVSVNTQKTALNALACLYNQFLKQPLGELSFTTLAATAHTDRIFSSRGKTGYCSSTP